MKYVSKFLDAIRPQASESELCLKGLLNEGFEFRQNHHSKLNFHHSVLKI